MLGVCAPSFSLFMLMSVISYVARRKEKKEMEARKRKKGRKKERKKEAEVRRKPNRCVPQGHVLAAAQQAPAVWVPLQEGDGMALIRQANGLVARLPRRGDRLEGEAGGFEKTGDRENTTGTRAHHLSFHQRLYLVDQDGAIPRTRSQIPAHRPQKREGKARKRSWK